MFKKVGNFMEEINIKKVSHVTCSSHKDWMEWRHGCISASDMSVYMDRSQYGNSLDIVENKAMPFVYEQKSDWMENVKSKEEDEAIQHYVEKNFKGYVFQKQLCIQADVEGLNMPLSCSLDAVVFDDDNGCVYAMEVKCTSVRSESDSIPIKYYHQIAHQLFLCNSLFSKSDFRGILYIEYCSKEKKVIKEVFITKNYINPIKLSIYKRFEKDIEDMKAKLELSPMPSENYVAEGTKLKIEDLTKEYEKVFSILEENKKTMEEYVKKAEELKDQISALIGDNKYKNSHSGLCVSKIRIAGRLNKDALPADLILRDYMNPPTYSLRITREKSDNLEKTKIKCDNGKMSLN